MPAQRPHMIVSESVEMPRLLIIDKNGDIAEAIIEKLKNQFQIVLVTGKEIKANDNISLIYYGKKIPMIPDENYLVMITIYQGDNTTYEILPSITEKASVSNSKLFLITPLSLADKQMKKLLGRPVFEKTTHIIYGEVFGKEDLEDNYLARCIYQIRTRQKIDVYGNGLQKTYPVLFEDVCEGIIAISLTPQVKAKTILLSPKHGYNQLAIARIFQGLDPLIKVNFAKEKNKETDFEFPQEAHYYFTEYKLEEKLKNINLKPLESIEKKLVKKLAKKNHKPKNKKTNLLAFLFICLIIFLLPIFFEILFLTGGSFFALQSLKSAKDNDIPLAEKFNSLAKAGFNAALYLGQNFSVINPLQLIQDEPIYRKAQIGLSLAEIESEGLEIYTIIKSIHEENSPDPKNDFHQVIAKTKNILISLQKLKAEGNLPADIEQKLNSLQKPLMLLGNTADTLPDLLGFNQKRKYIIIFQNNMELRPGGGFIGSYATVGIRNGKTDKLKINDIYDADGKMSIHVEPPFALKRYLGASHLFMRDSNFDVDFVAVAQKVISFLELETGEKVDGVIAIDTSFVKTLIEIFGPLYITDFKETVTEDNFYLLTQTHAEKDFFPGSTQKKDFLRAVYNTLEIKLAENKNLPFELLLAKISDAVYQKHLMFAVGDEEIQAILTVSKLSGSLKDNRAKEENKFLDFLSINEANIGVNKANYYLKRGIEQKVIIDENGNLNEKVTIKYENTSNNESVFGGDYKNYLRFILPVAAQLQSVEVNGVIIPTTSAVTNADEYSRKGFIPPQQLEVEKTQSFGKNTFGFLVIIPKSSSQSISITYSISNIYDPLRGVFNYDLYVSKQPGTDNDPYSVSIVYPNTFQAIQSPYGFSDVGGKLLYSDNLIEDKNLIIKFSKK